MGSSPNGRLAPVVDLPDDDLAGGVVEVDAEVSRALLGKLDELGLEDHAVDRHVDQRDLLLDAFDPFGAAAAPRSH